MDKELAKQVVELLSKNTEILEKMSQKESGDLHTKAPASAHTGTVLHGSGGILAGALEREVITAMIRPQGIAAVLPVFPNIDENPIYASLTGVTDEIGAQPADPCDDAPTGYIKSCKLSARFGRIRYDTNTIDIGKVMRRLNRGDFTDLQLYGKLLSDMRVSKPSGITEGDLLNLIVQAEMVTVGVLFEREITRQLWQGVTTIANEFPGLDVQVATGQKDAEADVYCPALDSDVKSYNYRLIDGTIVTYISMLEHYIFHNATSMGLMPVSWVWAMRPELWQELSAVWPCAYYTNRCASVMTDANASVSVDGREMVAIRDSMRQGMYIEINGRRYPVVTDSGIFEHNNINNANCEAGEYASTIYMLPLSIIGGLPVTYRQYLNYNHPFVSRTVNALRGNAQFWTDDGAFEWAYEGVKYCFKLAGRTEQRVVLRTPQLAGRIDAVKYAPLQHLRDYDPSSPYHMDGGVSVLPGLQAPYSVWSGR